MPKSVEKVLRAVRPYCRQIVRHKGHFKLYPKLGHRMIMMAGSPSDGNYHKKVYRDFKKYCGLDIPEILK